MNKRVLITGATGNVGHELIKSLSARKADLSIVAGVRDPEQSYPGLASKGIETVRFDFEDLSSVEQALSSCSSMFLLRPPQISDVEKVFRPIIDCAAAKGIEHLVFLSVQGAESNSIIPHHKIEKRILASGIPYTFLRPAYFMQNFSTTLRKDIAERREVFLPSGKAKFTLVDVTDVGAFAAEVLMHPAQHLQAAYDLSNDELLSFSEMCQQLTEVLGDQVSFRSPNLVSFFIRKRREKVPVAFIFVMIMLHYFPRFSASPKTSDAIQQVLKRAPRSFRDFAEVNKGLWERNQ